MTRDQVITAARELVGTPFRHQGRTIRGIDCVGFIWMVGARVGYDFPLIDAYHASPNGQRVAEEAAKALMKAPAQGWSAARAGDIILIDGWQPGVPQHLAIIGKLGQYRTMIHAHSSHMKVIEHRIMPSWSDKYHSTWTFPGLED